MRGLIKLLKYLWTLNWRAKLARVPRVASTDYDHIDPDTARIMSRYGIRSPSGIQAAMKKYKVNTTDDLVAKLEHHRAKRNMSRKWNDALKRLSGGSKLNPHTAEIRQINPHNAQDKMLLERIRRLQRHG